MFSHSGHVMTLANSIIGVGILAMPFCFQKCGIILSILLLIISNWVTRICCHYLNKSSLLTRRKSFEFLGFHAFGSSGKLLVELCIIGYLLGTCITYFVVVGDLGPQIITKMFSLDDGHVHLRTLVMIAVTVVCILPLGMLKNVDSLSTVCTASIGFYVCLVIKIILESEEHIVANDWTQKVLYWEPAGILQCLPIFSMALSCQMQLFEVFESVNNQSLDKLNGIVRNATWICTSVYIAVGFFGYVAFCTQSFSGNILMNFSPSFGSDVIKIGFILSVAFSFPLVIFPCRASIYSLLYRKGHTDASAYIPETRFKIITVFIVLFALCMALMIPSVELIIGLVGSTIGVAICVMFPAACFRKIVKKDSTERSLAQFILVGGFCLMILGTYANLSAIDDKRSGAHLAIVEENLMKPSELPISEDKLKILEEKLNFAEQEYKKELDKKTQKEDANLLMNDLNLENPKHNEPTDRVTKSIMPPIKLPVDEKHTENEEANQQLEKLEIVAANNADKLQVVSPIPDVVKIVPLEEVKKPEKKEEEISSSSPLPIKILPAASSNATSTGNDSLSKMNAIQQQSIDKEAIKKDEDIAAEEQKDTKDSNTKDDELKKTQNELKQTKELLERTVDELKEELAKQNKETQNLVVQKLDQVVEKVEQIERKVQEQQPQPSVETKKELQANAVAPQKEDEPQRKNKGSLLSILSENTKLTETDDKAVKSVYEPLSYKTGELIEHVRNGSKLDTRLPLPLALLINASQAKMNETLGEPAKEPKELRNSKSLEKTKSLENANKKEIKYEQAKLVENDTKPNETPPKVKRDHEMERENVEAIRRDLLQVNTSPTLSPPTANDATASAPSQRIKRSIDLEVPNLEAFNVKLEKDSNCLTEPKIETLMSHGLSNAIDFKIKGIGRELKSLKEKESN